MVLRLVLIALGLLLAPATVLAAQKLAVFPVEIDYQPSQDDFFFGEKKIPPEEEARLKMVYDEFVSRLSADDRYEVVDLSSLKDEIAAAQPLHSCNECDIDLAKKAGADVTFTVIVDKISETHLNMIVTLRDVATGGQLRNVQAVIQGNTDETWMHGARWLLKNRLLAEGKTQ